MNNLDVWFKDKAVILISHRVYVFENFDKVIFFDNGRAVVSTHEKLLENEKYRALYEAQTGGAR